MRGILNGIGNCTGDHISANMGSHNHTQDVELTIGEFFPIAETGMCSSLCKNASTYGCNCI